MKKILIVDDDRILGQMIKDILEWKGFLVKVSKVPSETIQNVVEGSIDLIILDKLISGTDGTEVCGWVRTNDKTANIPILMMTAMHSARELCLQAGASDFISKPFEIDDFMEKVNKLLQQGEHLAEKI
ncbi:MAG: response regulator [Leeuwenhoekiella sp.]